MAKVTIPAEIVLTVQSDFTFDIDLDEYEDEESLLDDLQWQLDQEVTERYGYITYADFVQIEQTEWSSAQFESGKEIYR